MEDQLVTSVLHLVRSLGGRALFVGGFVRDAILGIESKDLDIEIHGPVDIEALIEGLRTLGRVDEVGKSFGVIKIGDLDISFPRRDSKVSDGHTGFSVQVDQSITIDEALSRRDFTINSIALDPLTQEIFDPFSGGRDIQDGILRHTSDAFSEDPLRVLRAVQFGARFMFDIDPETAELCRSLRSSFAEISVERVWVEWEKILRRGKSMTHVTHLLQQTGWDVHFLDWCIHADTHTDRVLQAADDEGLSPERRMTLILATMFRNKPDELNHFLASIDAPLWLRRSAQSLCVGTRVPGDPAREARIIARSISPMRLEDWLRVHGLVKSALGRAAGDGGVLTGPRPPLLTGADLIERGLTPGPLFGTLLASALDWQDWEGWVLKEEALAWLDKEMK